MRAAERRQEFFLVRRDEVDDLLLLKGIVLTARTKQTERRASLGLVFSIVPFPELVGLEVAQEALRGLQDEQIHFEHIAQLIKDLQVRAWNISSGKEAETPRQTSGDLRAVFRLTKGELHVGLMDRSIERQRAGLGELRAQVADGGTPELRPTVGGAGFSPGDPVGIITEKLAIMPGQADAQIPENGTAVSGGLADVILPRPRVSGQEREELGRQALKRVRREFLQPLIAQDGAEPWRQAPGAQEIGVHLHAQAAVADQAVR